MADDAYAIGVDIGGSGIKAAVVDVRTGQFVGERTRIPTPQPATPEAVADTVAELVAGSGQRGPVGIGLPGAVVSGRVMTAAHIDSGWLGVDAPHLFAERLGRRVAVLNDADAAGLAEVRFGAGAGVLGVVLVLTLGTGIGSALFIDGQLVPNTELGHIEIRGMAGERRASAGAREREGLSFKRWAPLLGEYINRVDQLVWPDLVILGGGISRRADRFVDRLEVRPPVVAAELQNRAGIVGAAVRAAGVPLGRRG